MPNLVNQMLLIYLRRLILLQEMDLNQILQKCVVASNLLTHESNGRKPD